MFKYRMKNKKSRNGGRQEASTVKEKSMASTIYEEESTTMPMAEASAA